MYTYIYIYIYILNSPRDFHGLAHGLPTGRCPHAGLPRRALAELARGRN